MHTLVMHTTVYALQLTAMEMHKCMSKQQLESGVRIVAGST